ncbi:MAG TPA: RidA family protein [Sphingomicrobium sp.]|nr:RidA family protein [Sphingomicrobium sp.]
MAMILSALLLAVVEPAPIERTGSIVLDGRPLPFANAVRAGDMVWLSGQVGLRPDGTLPPDFEGQARQTMDNIGAILKSVKLGWGDVVKCTVMLDDIKDWPKFNPIYASYFPDGRFPARSALGADGLALGALLEVECIAYAARR